MHGVVGGAGMHHSSLQKARTHALASCVDLLLQAIEEETERADQQHTQQRAEAQREREAFEQEVTKWKVQFFDQQYERCVGHPLHAQPICTRPARGLRFVKAIRMSARLESQGKGDGQACNGHS